MVGVRTAWWRQPGNPQLLWTVSDAREPDWSHVGAMGCSLTPEQQLSSMQMKLSAVHKRTEENPPLLPGDPAGPRDTFAPAVTLAEA